MTESVSIYYQHQPWRWNLITATGFSRHTSTSTTNAAPAAAAASPMPRSIGAYFTVNVAARGASLTLTVLFVDLEGTLGLLRAIGAQPFLSGHPDHNPVVSCGNQGSRNNPKVPSTSTADRMSNNTVTLVTLFRDC
jgi:hypothetical protein